jgi:hypothetical protein
MHAYTTAWVLYDVCVLWGVAVYLLLAQDLETRPITITLSKAKSRNSWEDGGGISLSSAKGLFKTKY